ncbi:MAG: SprT-like domain-containing protein [Phycisphaerae bacterium]
MPKLRTDDIWTPSGVLPHGDVLCRLVDRIGEAWGIDRFSTRVRAEYNYRLRTTLGRAFLKEDRVELNPRLLTENPDQFVPTLAHELAHLVVHHRHGPVAKPHGTQFRYLMQQLGLSSKATHKVPVGHLKQKRRRYLYLHRCETCGVSFIARSIRRNVYCRQCGPGMRWRVLRAPATRQGAMALEKARVNAG